MRAINVVLVVVVMVCALAGTATVSARRASAASNVSWQYSEEKTVKLGVRDKYGSLGSYTADCDVTGPGGHKYHVYRSVKDSDWGYALFPDDFNAYGRTGNFAWRCVVKGRAVASGKFAM